MKMVEIAEQRLKEAKTAEDQVKARKDKDERKYEKALEMSEAAQGDFDLAKSSMGSAGFQLGWKEYPEGFDEYLTKAVGLLISIFAVSLGAPFWFDVLQKFMQIRAAGATPDEKKKQQCDIDPGERHKKSI
jgi:hypothetical protein